MAGKNIAIIKAPKIYEDICSMMFDFVQNTTGATTTTACVVKNTWEPFCTIDPEDDRTCAHMSPGTARFLPTIKATITWTDCELAEMNDQCQVEYMDKLFYNGQTHIFCPQEYVLAQNSLNPGHDPILPYPQFVGKHSWRSDPGNGQGGHIGLMTNLDQGLRMARSYQKLYYTLNTYFNIYMNNLLIIDKELDASTGSGYTNFDWVQFSFYYQNNYTNSKRAMDVMTSGIPSFNNYNLGEGMLLNPGSGVPPTTKWTDPASTITYTFERFQYWDCTLGPFSFGKTTGGSGVLIGDTVACDALYTFPGGNLKP